MPGQANGRTCRDRSPPFAPARCRTVSQSAGPNSRYATTPCISPYGAVGILAGVFSWRLTMPRVRKSLLGQRCQQIMTNSQTPLLADPARRQARRRSRGWLSVRLQGDAHESHDHVRGVAGVLEVTPPEARRPDCAAGIIATNCLSKPTAAIRRLTNQRLGELYGLEPATPLFRVLRRLDHIRKLRGRHAIN